MWKPRCVSVVDQSFLGAVDHGTRLWCGCCSHCAQLLLQQWATASNYENQTPGEFSITAFFAIPIEVIFSSLLRLLQACSGVPYLTRERTLSRRVLFWQKCASCLALAHTVLGTLILSSLVYVGFHDTLIILARLLVSTAVSRVIVLVELNVLRQQNKAIFGIDDAIGMSSTECQTSNHVPSEHSNRLNHLAVEERLTEVG
jgi:hypothetical protein